MSQDSPKNLVTNVPGLYAIGECNYQYHGGNRLGANSLLSCIFDGLIVAPGIENLFRSLDRCAADQPDSLFENEKKRHEQAHDQLIKRLVGGENPYRIHLELGEVMSKASTVVRHNDQLREAQELVNGLAERAQVCSLSDTGNWTNQNVFFTKALLDMFPLAKTILAGALDRDECRGAHYKPKFAMPSLTAESPAERRTQAQQWCDRFEDNNRTWLKSTIAKWDADDVHLSYEDVDTSLIPPRPRMYGLVGAEVIEEVWAERCKTKIEG